MWSEPSDQRQWRPLDSRPGGLVASEKEEECHRGEEQVATSVGGPRSSLPYWFLAHGPVYDSRLSLQQWGSSRNVLFFQRPFSSLPPGLLPTLIPAASVQVPPKSPTPAGGVAALWAWFPWNLLAPWLKPPSYILPAWRPTPSELGCSL